MTENEAIEIIKGHCKGCEHNAGIECFARGEEGKCWEVKQRAIMSMRKIQEYQAIGTVEEYREARDKLSEYEALEEQGKLLKLPCAVGDMVYTLNSLPSGKTVIAETTADTFFCALCTLEGRFGKTVFLTKEEAEAALSELQR